MVARRIEIVHESLLAKWPRLVHWQTQDADGAQLRDELRQAARLWQQHNRSSDFLWSGDAYREFRIWRSRYPGNLSDFEEDFANAVIAHASRRRTRRVAALSAFLIVAVVVSGTSIFLWRRAAAEARRAEAAKLLALGQLELDSYPTAALAYATKSLEVFDTAEARRFAVKALSRGPAAIVLPLPWGLWSRIRFSPNGKWLAASSGEDKVLIFPSNGDKPIVLGGHEATGGQRHVDFSESSDILITKTARGDPMRIWSIPGGKPLRELRFDGFLGPSISSTKFVRRAARFFVPVYDKDKSSSTLFALDLPTATTKQMARIDADVEDCDIDASATKLALARGRNVMIRALTPHGKDELLGTHGAKVLNVQFGPGDKLLSRDAGGEMRVWSHAGGQSGLLHVIAASPADESPVFAPDATRIATLNTTDRAVRLWDTSATFESQPMQLLRGGSSDMSLSWLEFSPKGEWLAADQFDSVTFWPLRRNEPLVFRARSGVGNVVFAPDGKFVTSMSIDELRSWPLDRGAESGSHVLAHDANRQIFAWAMDSKGDVLVASSAPRPAAVYVATRDGQRVGLDLPAANFTPVSAALDAATGRAAVGTNFSARDGEKRIRVWDVTTGRTIADLDTLQGQRGDDPYDGSVLSLAFAPDGSLYSAGRRGVLRWDLQRGSSERLLSEFAAFSMSVSDDARRILVATRPATFKVNPKGPFFARFHDVKTKTTRTLVSHGPDVCSTALNRTGSLAVTGSLDGTVRVGPTTGEEPYLLFGHVGAVESVAVSPDGKWIASGGDDGTLRVWPMPDLAKQPLHTLPHGALIAKLKSLTNVRVVADAKSPNGYKLDLDRFPGWERVPQW